MKVFVYQQLKYVIQHVLGADPPSNVAPTTPTSSTVYPVPRLHCKFYIIL